MDSKIKSSPTPRVSSMPIFFWSVGVSNPFRKTISRLIARLAFAAKLSSP
jgi:hypothetical protein